MYVTSPTHVCHLPNTCTSPPQHLYVTSPTHVCHLPNTCMSSPQHMYVISLTHVCHLPNTCMSSPQHMYVISPTHVCHLPNTFCTQAAPYITLHASRSGRCIHCGSPGQVHTKTCWTPSEPDKCILDSSDHRIRSQYSSGFFSGL